MTSKTSMERQVKSMVWMSEHSDRDVLKAERHILETYKEGGILSNEEFEDYHQIIYSLKDSGYLRCGLTSQFQVIHNTAEAGNDYLIRLQKRLGK